MRHYFTGRVCRYGHIDRRFTKGGNCGACLYLRAVARRPPPKPALNDSVILYDGPLIAPEEAVALGLNRYFTGQPCKNGHVAERSVVSRCCVTCLALSQARYQVTEKAKARKKRHARTEKAKATRRHSASELRYARSETFKATQARYRSTPKGQATYLRAQRSENGRACARRSVAARRARARCAPPGIFTAADDRKLRALQKKCHICGKRFTKADAATLDHVIALADGGTNDASNIALAHRSCNCRKRDQRFNLL